MEFFERGFFPPPEHFQSASLKYVLDEIFLWKNLCYEILQKTFVFAKFGIRQRSCLIHATRSFSEHNLKMSQYLIINCHFQRRKQNHHIPGIDLLFYLNKGAKNRISNTETAHFPLNQFFSTAVNQWNSLDNWKFCINRIISVLLCVANNLSSL